MEKNIEIVLVDDTVYNFKSIDDDLDYSISRGKILSVYIKNKEYLIVRMKLVKTIKINWK